MAVFPFDRRPFLVGVVHLPALPGAPRHASTMSAIVARAVEDATAYAAAGFDGVIVENFGDAPFHPGAVPAETIAALAVACRAVREAVALPVGANCLRNDGAAAVAIAAAAELAFIRVNVLTGAAVADQGLLTGCAHDVMRLRARLRPSLAVFADVHVKHAAPLAERPIEEEARDAVERGHADAIVLSGSRTGSAPDPAAIGRVADAVPHVPVVVGSGLAASNVSKLLARAGGAIVGTSVKLGGVTEAPVDAARAAALVRAIGR
ncbi:MAG TPA: BtpA/SgcQ family protein [Planctomycetota bacterium]|nr:BtpA/SgcQ family protein [Planctomycetota bacterium]